MLALALLLPAGAPHLSSPVTAELARLNTTTALRQRLVRQAATLGKPDAIVDASEMRGRGDAEPVPASVSSRMRGAVAADVQRMLSDVERMGKTEEDEMVALRTRVKVLERTVRERDDELREARPRIQALQAELASLKDENDGLHKANQRLKGHLGTVRQSLQASLSPDAMSEL